MVRWYTAITTRLSYHTANPKIHPHSIATFLTQQTVKAIHMATMWLSERSSPWTPAGVITATSTLLLSGEWQSCTVTWKMRYVSVSWIAGAQWNFINLINPTGQVMHQQFDIQQFYVQPTHCIYVFCIYLRTNSDLQKPFKDGRVFTESNFARRKIIWLI